MLTPSPTPKIDHTPREYDVFEACIRSRVRDVLAADARVFTTEATGLFDAFLAALPAENRQSHVCHCCRAFVERFGGLVTIRENGRTAPLLWNDDEVPTLYAEAVGRMTRLATSASVTGVFLSSVSMLGTPQTGQWSHMHAILPNSAVLHAPPVLSAEQVAAQKTQDYEMLQRGLAEFPADLCVKAHSLLANGQLFRSDKCVGVAAWLVALHTAREAAKGKDAKNNVVWRAVATAPAGFTHVRTGIIGMLLEDLAQNMDFAQIKRRFDAAMDPLQYMRPTAALSEGNREQAEKIIETLGVAKSLERRFARLDEVTPHALWLPTRSDAPAQTGGVFAHLKTGEKKAPDAVLGAPVVMTYEKFARVVLPDAIAIHYRTPIGLGPFCGLVTAQHADAPPILRWDTPEKRNPVSWYFYSGGSYAKTWDLLPNALVPVTAIALRPERWNGGPSDSGNAVVFLLEGARDVGYQRSGGFFVENLKSVFHEIRRTLEFYMLSAVVSGAKEATACGVALQGSGAHMSNSLTFRVTAKTGIQTDYRLDRWD